MRNNAIGRRFRVSPLRHLMSRLICASTQENERKRVADHFCCIGISIALGSVEEGQALHNVYSFTAYRPIQPRNDAGMLQRYAARRAVALTERKHRD